ncbi:VWA domain-containing protein [Halorubellus litoreus]|uniref:VWA domain-containing protein n=1 Tax=Halorubellus litoreus TaxID=755308 RepID=A0ABD5VJM3_9EURY
MELDRTTSRRELARLSTTDSRSERRRTELQRLANVLTDPALDVRVTFEHSGAFAHRAPEGSPHDFEIHIPVERFEQVETDQAPAVWDRRVQFGLLFHELGHVMYSDFERFDQRQSEVLPRHRDVYRSLFNAAEDVVIEAQLAAEFSLTRDFETLNETFRRLQHRDHERYVEAYAPDDAFTYTVYEALCIGILEHGFGAESRFRAILDPGADRYRVHDGRRDVVAALAPDVAAFVDDVLALPSGRDRVDRSVAFFETVRDHLDELPTVQSVRMQTEGFRPIEAGDYVLGSAGRATDLPEGPGATRGAGPGTGSGTTSRRGDASRPADSGDDATGGRPSGDDSVTSLLDDDRTESPLEREAAKLLELVHAEDVGLDRTGVVEVDDVDGDRGRWEAAKRRAEPLANDLRSTLRRRRRADERAGQRTGRIDPQRLARAAQGRDRVFKRRVRGDERDYRCLVVLDRSGSMDGDRIRDAESATAQLVHALHDVGVDVSVLSLLENAPFLELPFGGTPNRYADAITAGRASGWTPLTDTLEIARNRLDAGSGTRSFIVVVTDGAPDDEDAFLDQLDRCNVPVYGVYVDGDPGTHARFFDRIVYTDSSSLDATLRSLARQLLA